MSNEKTSRNDWNAASVWLDKHRVIAGVIGALAGACVIVLMLSPGSQAKRVIGVPLFAAIAAYMAYKAVGRRRGG